LRSTSAFFTRLFSVCTAQPILAEMDTMADQQEPCSVTSLEVSLDP
jgi:hypothetical protein